MITGVASCPQPPLLLAGMTGRPVAEVERLRKACAQALVELLATRPDEILIVGGARPDETGVPLSIQVGRSLLAELREDGSGRDLAANCPASEIVVDAATPTDECVRIGAGIAARGDRIGLLVMADGSARRGLKAPGYLDPDAAVFDARVQTALDAGAASALSALEPDLADRLMVAGRAAWQVLAGAVVDEQVASTTTHYADDPFGVWYPVVVWSMAC